MVDAMSEGTRSHPAHRLAVMPDRLIADGVGVGCVDFEGHQAQRPAALLLLGRRRAANEVALLEVHEAIETGLEGTIDGAVLPRPAAETLLHAHGVERASAEQLEPVLAP